MKKSDSVVVDAGKCTGCGLCVKDCPSDTLSLRDGRAEVSGTLCIGCGHCYCVCPEGAVSVGFLDSSALTFETVQGADGYLAPGKTDVGGLVSLMRSRRSVRDFSSEPLSEPLLRDLVRIGTTAPTGTNSQKWTFTVLPDRAAVKVLGDAVGGFFDKLNAVAENPGARFFSRLFLKDALGIYYRTYYKAVKEGLRQYREEGRDRLFFGAPAVILVGSAPGASCPSEDALLATQNIVLAAHAMGYGTCLIGFAVEAMKRDRTIKEKLGIPAREPIYSVIAIGKPRVRYQRPVQRASLDPRMRIFRKPAT